MDDHLVSRSLAARSLAALGLSAVLLAPPAIAQSPAALASAANSIVHLRDVMDEYHGRFPVYDDVSSGGNHFDTIGFRRQPRSLPSAGHPAHRVRGR